MNKYKKYVQKLKEDRSCDKEGLFNFSEEEWMLLEYLDLLESKNKKLKDLLKKEKPN